MIFFTSDSVKIPVKLIFFYFLFKLEINFQFEHGMSKNRQHCSVSCFIMILKCVHLYPRTFKFKTNPKQLIPSQMNMFVAQGLNK